MSNHDNIPTEFINVSDLKPGHVFIGGEVVESVRRGPKIAIVKCTDGTSFQYRPPRIMVRTTTSW